MPGVVSDHERPETGGSGKHFHWRKAVSLLLESSGRTKRKPHSFHPTASVTRTSRACRLCSGGGGACVSVCRWLALGTFAPKAFGAGAEGTSNCTRAVRCRLRRKPTNIPPALTLSAVVNSRNSLPSRSLPRTNTGRASGRRGQARRSGIGCECGAIANVCGTSKTNNNGRC